MTKCEICGGDLSVPGVIWDMGYRVAVQHGCDGDPDICATTCPVPTPDVELIPQPCPSDKHAGSWTDAPA